MLCIDLAAAKLWNQQVINFFLLPKNCKIVLNFYKHKANNILRKFIFVFIPYFTGAI